MSYTITVEYPETLPDAVYLSRDKFEQEARLAMVAKLFETGRLSSGQAVCLTGLTRVDFINQINQLKGGGIKNKVAGN